MMSSCLVMPRRGHLDTLFHAFTYLKKNHNAEMVFDPTEPEVDMKDFLLEDLGYSIYGDTKEDLLPVKLFLSQCLMTCQNQEGLASPW